jgi:topoisomerase IV subunit A
LLFALSEVRHQPGGGKGLTLMDMEPKDKLAAVRATSLQSLQVQFAMRGGKTKAEAIKAAALTAYVNKRARKGNPVTEGKAIGLGHMEDAPC